VHASKQPASAPAGCLLSGPMKARKPRASRPGALMHLPVRCSAQVLLACRTIFPIPPAMTRLLQLAFWAAALTALIAALLPHPPQLPGNPTDKLQHMAAFFTLAVLGGLAYPRLSVLRLLALLTLFGAFIEVAQLFPTLNRDAESADLVADVLAAGAGVLAVMGLRRLLARD